MFYGDLDPDLQHCQFASVLFDHHSHVPAQLVPGRVYPQRPSEQAVETSVTPSPPYVPSFLSRSGFIPTAGRFAPNLPTRALALSASLFLKKSRWRDLGLLYDLTHKTYITTLRDAFQGRFSGNPGGHTHSAKMAALGEISLISLKDLVEICWQDLGEIFGNLVDVEIFGKISLRSLGRSR